MIDGETQSANMEFHKEIFKDLSDLLVFQFQIRQDTIFDMT